MAPVSWAGKHNTIIAASGFHISEAKWLKCGKELVEDYVKFWLDEKSYTYLYSTWLIYSVYEYCKHINDFTFAVNNIDLLVRFFETFHNEHKTESGLYWSFDGNDAMELSISGTNTNLEREKGLRPTLNSYMAANAYALFKIARKAGKKDIACKYEKKFIEIKQKLNTYLWDGDFYKANHIDTFKSVPDFNNVPKERNAKELLGFIPWCFNLAPKGREFAFEELKNKDGFLNEYGFTTAEQRHKRYLYKSNHDCLWNGYIWPFATSQTLYAMINLLTNYTQNVISKQDFYNALLVFTRSQHITDENGQKICWIDENKNPITNEWEARSILKNFGWLEEKGGKERGKDYNHSAFCDIVLKGLLGITVKDGEITVEPKIPDSWEYFNVDNLWVNNCCYNISYTKNNGVTVKKVI